MTLAQLANFVRIAELGSLSKAAAVLRIAQPALSRQLRLLEADLGSSVFMRHAWGISLTPAGEILLVRARKLLLEAEAARDAIHALASEPTGRVAIGVPTSVAVTLLPALAAILRNKWPKLRPHLVDGFSAQLHGRMLAGELDLALLYEDRAIGPLETTPLLAENLMLVTSADTVVEETSAAEMLVGGPLILPARPNRLRLIVDEALANRPGDEPDILEVDSLPAIISMVERGQGRTVLPYSTVSEQVRRGSLATWNLQFPQLSRTLLLVRPLDRKLTAAVAAVEQEIFALVSELAGPSRWRGFQPPADAM